jgi:hypothetical protein
VSNVSATLLTAKDEHDYTGPNIPSDAYYGFTDGLHTLSIDVSDFTGRIYIESTLANQPTDNDWFIVHLNPITGYLEYNNKTGIEGYTFQGNLMYIRARVERSHLSGPPDITTLGHVNKILLNV